jgi:hypothetical protein
VASDVFEEDPAQAVAKFADDAGDVGPEVARIICPEALSGLAERLTRIASQQGVDCPCEWPGIEGGEVIPDWRGCEIPGALSCDDAAPWVFLPLDKGPGVISGFGQHDAQIQAPAACAEGQSVPGT